MHSADIGLVGLAVMGQNLALNMDDHGFRVVVYNRTQSTTENFIHGPAAGTGIVAADSPAALASCLSRPRKLVLMVRAGQAVDQVIDQLLPHLEPGDIIMDGGNSYYSDSSRRNRELAEKGIRFIGCGISGGEEGARHGPSVMPGGDRSAWPEIQPILQSIAAKVDGEPCCQWIGPEGSGHYVKMVHNGIEYGDMQLIGEAYHLLRTGLQMNIEEIRQVFEAWNRGVLDSYLIEITARILGIKDEDGSPLVEKILDVTGQKGTGKWTGINAMELGIPLTLIGEAVFARCLSSLKQERLQAEKHYPRPQIIFKGNRSAMVNAIQDALYAAKIISYAQGYMLMREAAAKYGWQLAYGDIALIWRGGCIIRSRFLNNIKQAFEHDPSLENLLLDDFFIGEIQKAEAGWREAAGLGVELGIPLPAITSALAFFDGYRCGRLPANLLQAQRDYFGAHTYERSDRPRGEFFHTDWSGSTPAASTRYRF